MKKYSLLLALLPCTFSSCAALTKYRCNRDYAVKKGMEDADAGRLAQPARTEGNSCEGEYSPSDFSKDYIYGFQQKKQEVCQVTTLANSGRADGEAGNMNKPQKAKLGLCGDMKNAKQLENAYENEFRKAYCAPARAATLAKQRAQSWQPADFETAFADCKGASSLKKSYNDAYQTAMAGNCTHAEAERAGAAEATAKRPVGPVLDRLSQCDAKVRESVKTIFERSYNATRDRLAKEEADRAAAEQARLRQAKMDEFMKNTATASIFYNGKLLTSRCAVANDRNFVQVDVENPTPEQILLQGNWKMVYYNADFGKITEDRTMEAVLLTANNKKSFQKMTLPRDASFCRAEFIGNQPGAM